MIGNDRKSTAAPRPGPHLMMRAMAVALLALVMALRTGAGAFAAGRDATAPSESAAAGQAGAEDYKLAAPRYIGSVYCYACHQELALDFAHTKMGKLFLVKPQNERERQGCEGCHGPGSNHADAGGGLGIGGLTEFRIGHGQSIETSNGVCLQCHDEAFWHGKTHGRRRMACFDCHLVMVRTTAAFQLAPAAGADASWNRRRTWGGTALAGLLIGAAFGGWRRLRTRSRQKG